MSFPVADADLASWRECRDCGLFQRLPSIAGGEAAACARCDALLRRAARHSVGVARCCAVVGAILLLSATTLPFVELRVLGRFVTSTLFTGPDMLGQLGMPALAVVIVFTLVVLPAVKIAIELAVLFGMIVARPPRWLAWLFGCLEIVSPWAMVEVFLLGAIVAYTRLQDLATVQVGSAIWALGGVMLTMVTIDATLDHEEVWRELEKTGPTGHDAAESLPRTSVAPAGIVGCDVCRRVSRASVGTPCPRCRHRLNVRTGSVSRVWALLLTAGLLYVPANVLPVMTVKRLGKGGPSTIINGVGELAANHLWPLAVVVLLASIIVPMVKLASLVVLLVLTHRRSGARLRARTRLFRFVHVIGRWSMIDVFMLATLVGVVQLGFLATVLPGLGAVAFCSVVLITMAATESFDPRVMWDAAGCRSELEVPAEAGAQAAGAPS
jgi:paraquat-inducible protein A